MPLELQRAQLVAARALDRLELAGQRVARTVMPAFSVAWAAATGITVRPRSARRAAADEGDARAVLVGDDDVVDAGAAAQRRPRRPSAVSTSPPLDRREEVDRQAGGDGELVARVAGEREGRIGQRRDEAAVADRRGR